MYVVSLHAGLKLNEAYKINRHQDNRTLIKKFKTHLNGSTFQIQWQYKVSRLFILRKGHSCETALFLQQ